MKFKIDQDYHIHSYLSSCSNDPEQTPENILKIAGKNGIRDLCITDHFWDSAVPGAVEWYQKQDFDHISRIKPLPQADGMRLRFGCECEMDRFFNIGVSKERLDEFEFIIIPTTHLHFEGFTIFEEDTKSDERRAKLWVERFEKILEMDLPFHKIGLAHPACGLIKRGHRADYCKILDMIPENDMRRLFKKAASLGMGIEINSGDMNFEDEEEAPVLRMFRIAKEEGAKFYLGSDAHHLQRMDDAKRYYERAIDLLGLTEDDKFRLPD